MRSTLYGWGRLLAVAGFVEWASCVERLDRFAGHLGPKDPNRTNETGIPTRAHPTNEAPRQDSASTDGPDNQGNPGMARDPTESSYLRVFARRTPLPNPGFHEWFRETKRARP